MGLFSRKPKEHIFDATKDCAFCKQPLDDIYFQVTFYDAEYIARKTVVHQVLLHLDSDYCRSEEFISKVQPAGTIAEREVIGSLQAFAKRGDKVLKERKRLEQTS